MQMRSYKLTDFGKPVQEVIQDVPEPRGTEVLVRVTRAGVCHSDLHIADGYYDLGGGKSLSLGERGIKLPRAMGHEILGVVEKGGPDAGAVPVGATRLVHPWLGCGECDICLGGQENYCTKPAALGVFRDGGYAEYVIVPHPQFLVDIGAIDPSVATPYACSGVTVYSAIKKALPVGDREWLTIMGAGGLGLMAVSIARAMGVANIVSCDIDDAKLAAAKQLGAAATVNTKAPDALKQLRSLTGGGPRAVVDAVGAEATAELGVAALVKGGRYVIVGLYGGGLTLSLPTIPLRAISVIGSYVGNLVELKELIELVKAGKVAPIPVTTRPLAEVARTLDDLRAGRIVGRVVLTN
jgi:D-arabinose 1-dehydrogenase-like Zn-dependent alcohol dehydrogenase